MQPFARPALCDLVNERIDYLSAFQIAGQREPELRWCQGGVIAVLDRKKPTVRVLWDEMPEGGPAQKMDIFSNGPKTNSECSYLLY